MSKNGTGRPYPSARVAQKREQVRHEILENAQDILRDGGIEAVTLASVAGKLNMTKQALYHYFPSKEALIRSLITTILDDEIETLIAAIEGSDSAEKTLGTLIRAYHKHYIERLDAFRTVYCQSQLYTSGKAAIDKATLREEIHPRTRHLFDLLEDRISKASANNTERRHMRQLAYSAWMSALGLMTMLGVAEANNDPLVHTDQELLNILAAVFDEAVARERV